MTADAKPLLWQLCSLPGVAQSCPQGRPPAVGDEKLIALAVAQAASGICSDRQFLGMVGKLLPGWLPRLPDQSQYDRRLRDQERVRRGRRLRLLRRRRAGAPYWACAWWC